MKTFKLLSIVFLLCFPFATQAQFSYGIRAGYTSAWQHYGDVIVPQDANITIQGLHASALLYWKVGEHLSLGTEPGYARRGAACAPGFSSFDRDTSLMVNYLAVPILLSYQKPIQKDKLFLVLKGGYGAAVAMSAFRRVTEAPNGGGDVAKKSVDIGGERVSSWDHGAYGSIGLSLKLKEKRQVFLESMYYYGLKDVDSVFVSENRSIQVGLGYLISF